MSMLPLLFLTSVIATSEPCPIAADAPPVSWVEEATEGADLNTWRLILEEGDLFEDIPLEDSGAVYRLYIDPETGIPYALEPDSPCSAD